MTEIVISENLELGHNLNLLLKFSPLLSIKHLDQERHNIATRLHAQDLATKRTVGQQKNLLFSSNELLSVNWLERLAVVIRTKSWENRCLLTTNQQRLQQPI